MNTNQIVKVEDMKVNTWYYSETLMKYSKITSANEVQTIYVNIKEVSAIQCKNYDECLNYVNVYRTVDWIEKEPIIK